MHSARTIRAECPLRALCAVLLLVAAGSGRPLHAQSDTLVFVNVNVVLPDRYEILTDRILVVVDGRIAEIGAAGSAAVPAGATRIDARGGFLVPGLIDLDGHIPHPDDAYGLEDVLLAYLARGVTGVRGYRTHRSQSGVQRRLDSGRMLGPRLFLVEVPAGVGLDTGARPHALDAWLRGWFADPEPGNRTPYERLHAVTAGAAVALGLAEVSGTIESGGVADLVLLEANPFEDLAAFERPAGVVTRGRWVPRARIEDAIEDRARDVVREFYASVGRGSAGRQSCTGLTLDDCFDGDADCHGCRSHAVAEQRPLALDRLGLLAALHPASDWIAGQRVNFALKHGETERALDAAEACGGTKWWCQALRGYVLHSSRPGEGGAQLDSAFAAAPPGTPAWGRPTYPGAGDRGLHCEWSDLSALVTGPLRAAYLRTGCGPSTAFEDRFWWLADPLWSVPGNERRTEHLARNVAMRLHDEILRLRRSHHPQSHHRAVMPAGLANSWRTQSAGSSGTVTRVEYYVNGGYSFTPDAGRFHAPEHSAAEDWEVTWNRGHERMITRETWHNLEHQTAVLHRRGSLEVLAAAPIPARIPASEVGAAHLAMGRPADLHVESAAARVEETGIIRARIELDSADWVASIEILGDDFRGRARHGAPAPPLADGFGVSDPILVDDSFEPGARPLLDALLPSSTLIGRTSTGVYFEVYGTADDEPLHITISGERVGGSFLGRITGAILRRRPEHPLHVRWTEPAKPPVGGAMQRAITVDLSRLDDGEHRLTLTVERVDGRTASSSRVIRVNKP